MVIRDKLGSLSDTNVRWRYDNPYVATALTSDFIQLPSQPDVSHKQKLN